MLYGSRTYSYQLQTNNSEDLGAAVVKPTDSNPDATKKTKQVSGDAQQKSQGAADPTQCQKCGTTLMSKQKLKKVRKKSKKAKCSKKT